MPKKKINIGLDIGVASVGWSILDEENNLINYGSRLFPDAADESGKPKNLERRSKRSARRRLSRIKNRKRDLLNLFINNNLIQDDEEFAKILEKGLEDENGSIPIIKIKAKGLKEKLPKNELLLCLYHYIHHRGYFYITEEDLKDSSNKLDNNISYVKKFPSEIQLEFFEKNGYYKGMDDNQNFSNIKWREEVEEFLNKQNISDEFNKNYLSLFSRIRDFATGPGSKKSPTPYGLYRDKSGVPIGENLWDALIGKCTIYPEINRGGKNSPIAEIFNLLNDLNNIYLTRDTNKNSANNFPDEKLSAQEKKVIIDDFNKSLSGDKVKKSLNLKLISKIVNQNRNSDISESDISGYRIDKDKKPLITKLENTITIAKWMIDNKILSSPDLKNKDTLISINNIFEELARTSDLLKRIDFIRNYVKINYNIELSFDVIKKLVENVKGVTQTHSLSYKAMLEYIEIGIEYCDENGEEKSLNSQQFFSDIIVNNRGNNDKFKNKDGSPKKYIPKNIFKDEIISPTSKRSFIQTINVINKIIKLYSKDFEINNIVIELAREKNDAEKRKWINDSQKNNEKEIDIIFKENNIDNYYKNNLNSKTRLKLKLLKEQDYYDIYDGQKIDPIDVIQNQGKYHEEHIIPFSVCFIDSRRNKVVSKFENNKEKGNQTPYQWLSSKGEYENFKNRVIKLYESKKISKAKKEFLLFEKDPKTDLLEFIEKNLSDTRYACKLVLDVFQSFFKTNKELYPETKIKVINGEMTNYARHNLFYTYSNNVLVSLGIQKRREFYEHHAVDATILAFLGSNAKISKLLRLKKFKGKSEGKIIEEETGEVLNIDEFMDYDITHKTKQLSKQIFSINCKFSRPIYRKKNIGLSNETVYSMRWKNDEKTVGDMISKIDLLDQDDSLSKVFDSKNEKFLGDKLLCFQNDKILYNHLKNIYEDNRYYNNGDNKELHINPFINYMRLNFLNDGENETGKKTKFKHVIIDLNGSKKFVRYLKYAAKEKTIDNIILMNPKFNDKLSKLGSTATKNIGFKETLNALSVRIYRNDDGKYITFPINQKVIISNNNKMIIDNNKIDNLLNKEKISNKNFISINSGQAIINNNGKLFYFVGGGNFKENRLEIKPINYKNENRMQTSLSTIIQEYKLCDVDELGNIYNIREISL